MAKAIGPCEICYTTTPLDRDHCHETGRYRGMLCRKCNIALGMVNENIDTLMHMVYYIEQWESR